MMTIERASELVSLLREAGENDAAIDLFCHFDLYFDIAKPDGRAITQFAELCGFGIAKMVRPID